MIQKNTRYGDWRTTFTCQSGLQLCHCCCYVVLQSLVHLHLVHRNLNPVVHLDQDQPVAKVRVVYLIISDLQL